MMRVVYFKISNNEIREMKDETLKDYITHNEEIDLKNDWKDPLNSDMLTESFPDSDEISQTPPSPINYSDDDNGESTDSIESSDYTEEYNKSSGDEVDEEDFHPKKKSKIEKEDDKSQDLVDREYRKEQRSLLWTAYHRTLRKVRRVCQKLGVEFDIYDTSNLSGAKYVFVDFDWEGNSQIKWVKRAIKDTDLPKPKPRIVVIHLSEKSKVKGVYQWIEKDEDMEDRIEELLHDT